MSSKTKLGALVLDFISSKALRDDGVSTVIHKGKMYPVFSFLPLEVNFMGIAIAAYPIESKDSKEIAEHLVNAGGYAYCFVAETSEQCCMLNNLSVVDIASKVAVAVGIYARELKKLANTSEEITFQNLNKISDLWESEILEGSDKVHAPEVSNPRVKVLELYVNNAKIGEFGLDNVFEIKLKKVFDEPEGDHNND